MLIQIEEIKPQGKLRSNSDRKTSDKTKNINKIKSLEALLLPFPSFAAKKKFKERIVDNEVTKQITAKGAIQPVSVTLTRNGSAIQKKVKPK